MLINRVLNNNCIIILDDNDKEMILFGNGIGYAKKPGHQVDKDKISKTFVLEDKAKTSHFEEILNRVNPEVVEISETLIEKFKDNVRVDLNESIHIALPDHIDNAIKNFESGVKLVNTLLQEIKRFHPEEYQVGLLAIDMIRDSFGLELPVDEAGYIAMHFVNAQKHNKDGYGLDMTFLINNIDTMIQERFAEELVNLDKDSLIYSRYATHLKFFAQRVLSNVPIGGSANKLNNVFKEYTREYACSQEVADYIKEKYDYEVGEDEKMYLTVHIVQLIHKNQQAR